MPSRYEQEIDEIVKKAGDLRPRRTWRQRRQAFLHRIGVGPARRTGKPFGRITPTMVGGSGAIVLVIGLVLGSAVISFVGLGMLLGAYLLAIALSRGTFHDATGYDKSWRGRPIDGPSDNGGARRWFGRRR